MISSNCDLGKRYKFGCVVSCFGRQSTVDESLRSLSSSFLPEDLLFVLIDDGSEPALNFSFNHDHILIRKGKNYGISHSLVLGWDILNALGVEYMMNLDSDAVVSRNWLSRLLSASGCAGDNAIVTGFNGSNHKEKYVIKKRYSVKESIGGINLFFRRGMYGTVRKSLTSHGGIPSSVDEAVGLMEAYGRNPKIHEKYNGWDWGLMSLCAGSDLMTVCTVPSVVQHIGVNGLTSSPKRYETAPDFQDVCVPRIIHQMWRDENIPDHLGIMQSSVKSNNPEFEYLFWTDEKIDEFICSEYPELFTFYDSFQYVIQKVDFARLLILYHFGGVYIDLDSMCFGGVDDILGFPVSVVSTRKHEAFSDHYPFILNNAFIAAERNNDFIKRVIFNIIDYKDPPSYRRYSSFDPPYTKVLRSAGPLCITEAYMNYEHQSLVNILKNNYYYGASVRKDDLDEMVKTADILSKTIAGCRLLHIHESSWWKVGKVAIWPPKNKKHRVLPDWYKDKIKLPWS